MPKLILLISFFFITPIVFVVAILLYLSIAYHSANHSGLSLAMQQQNVAYAALPTTENIFDGQITAEDARAEAIRQFFARYGSPLEPYAQLIVDLADQYDLDYRLLPAIAMQESTLCKRIPSGSHNCWGFGIYGGKVTRFDSYDQAIETITRTLATKYKEEKGLETPTQIMTRYTPSSNGSWAKGVNTAMREME